MANELTIIDQSKQNVPTFTKKQKCDPYANKLSKGNIVYKRDTGMAFEIGNVSIVNGIEHYQLICAQTNSHCFLSKFALKSDYTEDSVKVEHLGIKIVRRLSKIWSN